MSKLTAASLVSFEASLLGQQMAALLVSLLMVVCTYTPGTLAPSTPKQGAFQALAPNYSRFCLPVSQIWLRKSERTEAAFVAFLTRRTRLKTGSSYHDDEHVSFKHKSSTS